MALPKYSFSERTNGNMAEGRAATNHERSTQEGLFRQQIEIRAVSLAEEIRLEPNTRWFNPGNVELLHAWVDYLAQNYPALQQDDTVKARLVSELASVLLVDPKEMGDFTGVQADLERLTWSEMTAEMYATELGYELYSDNTDEEGFREELQRVLSEMGSDLDVELLPYKQHMKKERVIGHRTR